MLTRWLVGQWTNHLDVNRDEIRLIKNVKNNSVWRSSAELLGTLNSAINYMFTTSNGLLMCNLRAVHRKFDGPGPTGSIN